MLLKDYIPNINKKFKSVFFSGVAFNSSKVKKDNIFFAIKGNKTDGNNYIQNAINNGAKIIVTENRNFKKRKNILFLKDPNVRKLLAEISYKLNKKKPKKLVAVTGTNGKSSIADFFFQILDLNKKKVSSIGTLGIRHRNKKKTIENTTLDPINLSLALKDLVQKKIEYIIIEASSHGLKQNRLDGLNFDIGIFTNLSHDHLDYHKNMKDYFVSKLYLFKKLVKKRGYIISDVNIPQIKTISNIAKKRKVNLNLISTNNRSILNNNEGIELISHKFENEKQFLEIKFKKKKYYTKINLVGKVQLKNLLMAILAANKSGIGFDKIISILHKIKPVEGRLEKIGQLKNNGKVILDYAHSPAALELSLKNLKNQFPNSNISLVFGCGGNRDFKKRSLMGRIAEKYSDRIYLTDDNPRNEKPSKIREEIKKGIKGSKIYEIGDRRKAIHQAIKNLKTGELLLVAGKGHEKFQDFGTRKLFFSDREIILKSIKFKNQSLSNNYKLNIINDESQLQVSNKVVIKNISINTKTINKNDVFFAIKGKKLDGNQFISEAFKKKSSLAIVTKINKKSPLSKQVRVVNSLNFLNKCSSILRDNVKAKIISITGSCGKTTLKEMIGNTLKGIARTTISPKSFNNKFGVPLSLFNLNQSDEFGVFEVGMDKKGEINNLTKIIKPDLGIITNISYAHSKNFKNIKGIAAAKAEMMNNIKKDGLMVLNKDDNFYNYHKKIALKKKLKVISFAIKDKSSMIKLKKLKKLKNKFEVFIDVNGKLISFYSSNDFKSNLYNILATIAAINPYIDLERLKKNTFMNIKLPDGRGDISSIKIKSKKFFLVDESYNSNPLSLKSAIENFDKIKIKNSKKYLILGDMLELGKDSIKQHKLIAKIINKTSIDRVYVIGKNIKETFKGLNLGKKGKIINNKSSIINLIHSTINNNDYLMIKGSNSTGLHELITNLKLRNLNVV